MNSHQVRSRRHDGSAGEDEELSLPLLSSRGEEGHTERYSRSSKPSSYRSNSHRSSSKSRRTSYDSNREASSSRPFPDTDDWLPSDIPRSSHERYSHSSHKDSQHSSGKSRYDRGEPRNSDSWSNRTDHGRYTSSSTGREWTQRYEQGHPSSSHADWNDSSSHGRQTPTYEWPPEEGRTRSSEAHTRGGREDRHSDRESTGWPKEDRRDQGSQSWKRDWEPRRRENHGKGWEPRRWNDTHQENSHRSTEDRSWEPAASWQSTRGETQGQRGQHSKDYYSHKNNKSGRKPHQNHKYKRDWRNDDGNLNNWQRREPHQLTSKTSQEVTKRRQVHSPSRSRSHSPESYHSRHSSPVRSRSRSSSPKRKWRGSSPVLAPNHTPSDRGRRKTRSKRQPRASSKSQSPRHYERGAHRRRSLSSSSSSRSRSTSRSPLERPKAIHRLPPATSVSDIPLSSINLSKSTSMRPPRDIPLHRNGRNQANGRHTNLSSAKGSYEASTSRVAVTTASTVSDMPPPPVPTAVLETAVARPPEASSVVAPPNSTQDVIISASSRTRHKAPGFRPIGQSSAVKKFFPSDDDDDVKTSSPTLALTASLLPVPAPTAVEQDKFHSQEGGSEFTRDSASLTLLEIPSPPHRNAPQAFRDDIQPLRESTNDWHPDAGTPNWPQQITDHDGNEFTRSASPSGGSPGELYAIISQVGEGTFGKVYKARNTVTKVHVALKRIRMEIERDGFPVTAMREIKLLQSLRHNNVVRLYEMMVSNGSVYMVFEYMDHDLTGVLSQTQFSFTAAHLKSLCQQMLSGLAYLHHKGVIHRDIKGSNILVNNRGELKLADFGLARFYQKRRRSDYTNRVITLWYRPPELLFGATVYGPEVDMWSAGCIMLELFTKKPIFQGNDEIHQLDVIYKIIGTPSHERWSGVASLPWYELVKPKEVIPNHFRELFQKWLSPAALDLAERLLAYDPSERATASQALEAHYFTEEEPPAAMPVGLATLEGEWHELETKRERAKKRRKIESAAQ